MPTIKITRKAIAALKPSEKPVTYYDNSLPGFGLRIMPSGAKSWIVEYRPGAGGRSVAKKRMRIGGVELMPEQARTAAEQILSSVSLGKDPAAERSEERGALTVADVSDRFMQEHVRKKRKANSAENYNAIFEVHVKPALGKKSAVKLTRGEVSKFHSKVAEKKPDGTGGPYVANKTLAVLSSMYEWAAKTELIPEGINPTTKIERFKEDQRERFLTSEELERLGAAMDEAETVGLPYEVDETKSKSKHTPKGTYLIAPHPIAALRLLILTGCRLREILNLRWEEIDFERGIAFLPDSKTGKKAVVLSTVAIDLLAKIPRIGIYVIAGDSAGMPDEKPRHDLKKPWAAISKRAGLFGTRIHDIRHTYASIGAGGGLGPPIIGKLLGHSQASTTQRYAHLDTDPVRRAADLIANEISEKMRGK